MPTSRSAAPQTVPPRRWGDHRAALHGTRQASLRRGRVGDPRRRHRRPRPGLRAARRRVPQDLVAERHEHRHPEVLPRPHGLRRARVLGEADGRPRGRHHRRAGGARAATSPRDEDADAFEAELTHILLHQMAAFNSPVWFNVGFEEHPQCSACFILSVEDTMESILDWNTKEGQIFRGGSGSGINLSNIRALDRAPEQGRHRLRARSASCAAPTPGPARSSPAARPAARPRWSCSTSTTPTSSTSSGARRRRRRRRSRCATPASTCRSTARASPRSSTRTPTTPCACPTSSWSAPSAARTGSSPPAPTARPSPPRRPTTCCARSPTPRGAAPIRASSTTPPSTTGTPARTRAGSTRRTRARSTCTWTTRRATSPRSTS